MSRFSGQLLVACLLIGLGIFYGIEIARNGIEHVNGPLHQEHVEVKHIADATPKQKMDDEKNNAVAEVTREPLRPMAADKTIHRLAGKTEHILETTLQGGVELIVSIFEVIVH